MRLNTAMDNQSVPRAYGEKDAMETRKPRALALDNTLVHQLLYYTYSIANIVRTMLQLLNKKQCDGEYLLPTPAHTAYPIQR